MLINNFISSVRGTGLSADEIIDYLRTGRLELWPGIMCAPTSQGVILRTNCDQLSTVRLRYSAKYLANGVDNRPQLHYNNHTN